MKAVISTERLIGRILSSLSDFSPLPSVFHPVASLSVSKTGQLISALLLFRLPNKQGSLLTWTTKFLAPGRRYLRRWWRVCRGWSTEGTIQQVGHEDAHGRARAHRCTRAQSTPWQHLCYAFQPRHTDSFWATLPTRLFFGIDFKSVEAATEIRRRCKNCKCKNMCMDFIIFLMLPPHVTPQKKCKCWLVSCFLKVFVHRISTPLT